ncbi:MAG: hypothetical protein EAZ85_03735 [Bacteroidetes bacterium]|nr:MAG: hypothetical protein EAZ85_03735 [Bacteroidota bacterium]
MSILFSQPDWQLFTNLNTLPQQAGIAKHLLPKLVVKELIDNALDTNTEVQIIHEQPELWTDVITIRDFGQGISGTNEEIAYLFSLRRPLTSSKRLRLPQRGALGNGLRVVMGTVYCMNGSLEIATKGRRIQIIPQDDGYSQAVFLENWTAEGTEIKITFKENLFGGKDLLQWAKYALKMPKSIIYQGKTNAFWYDSDSFYNLLLSLPADVTLIDFLKEFNPTYTPNLFKDIDFETITRENAENLLTILRENDHILSPKKLGKIGEMDDFQGYSSVFSNMIMPASKGSLEADIPVVIECFVKEIDLNSDKNLTENVFFVNRTPIVGDINFQFLEKKIWLYGCGLQEMIEIPKFNTDFFVWVNILTPYMPIVSNGKEPDFSLLNTAIVESIVKAIQHFKKKIPKKIIQNQAGEIIDKIPSQKQIVLENLEKAIDKASGNGKYRYSLRQLYYALRPFVMENTGKELKYAHFNLLITEFEFEKGEDLKGVYRDERGTLLHPHTQEEIKLGTKNIEKYHRPSFNFNKIIYSEKEGFFEILKEANFPEKFDCALLTSKGFASRAARDVLDLLADTEEELQFFCLHDADLSGTLIYQALQHATKARPERKVSIINLGLDAWEGLAMGLEVEKLESKQSKTPANYVLEFDKNFDNPKPFHFPKYENYTTWEDWLKYYRVELNAMDTPTFIDWLSQKIRQYDKGKVIPPEKNLMQEAQITSEITLKEKIKQEILSNLPLEKWIEEKFMEKMPLIQQKINAIEWEQTLKQNLSNEDVSSWRASFRALLDEIIE